MNSKFFYFAAAALTLASCSQEEVQMQSKDAISFGVTANLATRAANSFCNTNKPEEFQVYASTVGDNSSLYLDNVTVKASNGIYTAANCYWPESALNFYAHKNGTFSWNEGAPQITNFTPAENAGDQLDLLYAVKNKMHRQQVPLNFRHALSQLVFRAYNNAATNLDITISEVKVGYLTATGTFNFPTMDTDNQNYVDHETDGVDGTGAIVEGTQGTWRLDNATAGKAVYTTTFDDVLLTGSAATLTPTNHLSGGDKTMLVLPQTAAKWNPTVPTASKDEWGGAYFQLKVNIVSKANDATIYSGYACVPVDVNWEQGKRYIYTFIFDENGHGGYRPDPSNPQPVFGGITFNVSCDDMIDGDEFNTDMDK